VWLYKSEMRSTSPIIQSINEIKKIDQMTKKRASSDDGEYTK